MQLNPEESIDLLAFNFVKRFIAANREFLAAMETTIEESIRTKQSLHHGPPAVLVPNLQKQFN